MPVPVVLMDSGGIAATETDAGLPVTPVDSGGWPITLVASGGLPVRLVNNDLSAYAAFAAPVLTWDGDTTDTTPDFSVTLDAPLVGDIIYLDLYSDSGLTLLVDSADNRPDGLTESDITNGTISLALGAQADGTYYAAVTHERNAYSVVSNTETVTISTAGSTAPLFLLMSAA
jgi:hypothetical protein